MKIKGLVWGAALMAPMALNGGLRAEQVDLTSMLDEAVAQTSCCEADICGADCCDACDCGDGCGCGCFAPFWYAGAEFMFMGFDSDFGRGNVYFESLAGTAGRTHDGYDDFTFAPRLTLGRQLSENWGVQTRFFYLSEHDSEADGILDPANPPSAAFGRDASARLYTIDVEAVRRFEGNVWKVDGTAGVRHGSLDLSSDLSGVAAPGGGDIQIGNSLVASSFDGTGLTGALIGRRQLGNSRAHLFTGVRGSVLWGDADTHAEVLSLATGSAPAFAAAHGSEDTEMYITELTIGVQWDFALRYLPANAFFRTAFEYQNWDIDGGSDANIGQTAVGAPPAPRTTTGASADPAEVDLYGLVIGTGFTW